MRCLVSSGPVATNCAGVVSDVSVNPGVAGPKTPDCKLFATGLAHERSLVSVLKIGNLFCSLKGDLFWVLKSFKINTLPDPNFKHERLDLGVHPIGLKRMSFNILRPKEEVLKD